MFHVPAYMNVVLILQLFRSGQNCFETKMKPSVRGYHLIDLKFVLNFISLFPNSDHLRHY